MHVIVVDDSVIVREGLRRLLEVEGHQVDDTLAHPADVVAAVASRRPDAVVLDIRMPPTFVDEGLKLAEQLRRADRRLGILVLSQVPAPEYATRLLAAGTAGAGYLLKESILQPLQLTHALTTLAAGGTYIDPELVGELLAAKAIDDRMDELTAREREVLAVMAEGLADKGIAARLHLSVNTIETHVQRIFRKLELPDAPTDNRRILAVLRFLQQDRQVGRRR
jgi:DNA-binding NarL/FixJ family response regulator